MPLPALQETLPDSLSFELLARRPDLQALRILDWWDSPDRRDAAATL